MVLGVIIAFLSVIAFIILTEDISKPMEMTDKWTIGMSVPLVVESVIAYLGLKWRDVK